MTSSAASELAELFAADGSGGVTLLGSRCPSCGRTDFPARQTCLRCGARELLPTRLSGRGTVHESTKVVRPPAGFPGEYVVGMIDLDEGPRVFGLLLGECAHGSRVRVAAARLPGGADAFAFEVDRG